MRSIAGGPVVAPSVSVSAVGSVRLKARTPAAGAIAFAANATGGNPATVAVRVLVPNVLPMVHATDAFPLAPVVCEAALTVPPPRVTAKVTAAPGTGRLLASVTRTVGAMGTA